MIIVRISFALLLTAFCAVALVRGGTVDEKQTVETPGPDYADERPVDKLKRALSTPGLGRRIIQEMIEYQDKSEKIENYGLYVVEYLEGYESELQEKGLLSQAGVVSYYESHIRVILF